MYDDAFDLELEDDAREQEYQWRLATHDQDYRDNMECLALAVDYIDTVHRKRDAWEARDADLFARLQEHHARIINAMNKSWPTLEAAILRGDYGQ